VEPGNEKAPRKLRDAPRRWPPLGTLRRLHTEAFIRSSGRSS
jgi:hypothetical protein